MPARACSSSPGRQAAARRIASVEGARGIAALSVVAFHVLQSNGTTWLAPVTSRLWVGVPLFFAISGFVLFRPFARAIVAGGEWPQPGRYARSRALRILPALWVMTAVSLFVLHPHMRGGVLIMVAACTLAAVVWHPPTTRTAKLGVLAGVPALTILATVNGVILSDTTSTRLALEQFSLLQLYTLDKPVVVIGPVWTLCIEAGFYLVLPAVSWAMLRAVHRSSASRPAVVGGSLLALAAAGLLYQRFMGWGFGVPTTVIGFVPQFAAGMWVALASECRWFRRRGWPLGAAAIGVAAVAIAVQNVGPANNTEGSGPLFGALAAAAFALGLASVVLPEERNLFARSLSLRPLVWLGTISYGVYLWHYPVLLWVHDHAALGSTALDFTVILGATLVLASVSWYCIERPALRLTEWRGTSDRVGRRPDRTLAAVGAQQSAEVARHPGG